MPDGHSLDRSSRLVGLGKLSLRPYSGPQSKGRTSHNWFESRRWLEDYFAFGGSEQEVAVSSKVTTVTSTSHHSPHWFGSAVFQIVATAMPISTPKRL